jgi:hypothetical protein
MIDERRLKKLLREYIPDAETVDVLAYRIATEIIERVAGPSPLAGEFAARWARYPKKIGKAASIRHWTRSVRTRGALAEFDRALTHYLADERVKKGFVMDAHRFFRRETWQDWAEYEDPKVRAAEVRHSEREKLLANQRGARARAEALAAASGPRRLQDLLPQGRKVADIKIQATSLRGGSATPRENPDSQDREQT